MTRIARLGKTDIKVQTIAALLAVIAAIALPQAMHLIGRASGLGTALGETFLPMHLPIILVGLIAGPFAGAIAGAASPALSFLLTGMPGAVMLPFMVIELFAYGLFAGLLRDVKLPCVAKVLTVQILGRVIRAAAILAAVYVFSYTGIGIKVIYASVLAGLPGLILQLCLIPLIIFWINNFSANEK